MQLPRQPALLGMIGFVDVLLKQRRPKQCSEERERAVAVGQLKEQGHLLEPESIKTQCVAVEDAANAGHVQRCQTHTEADNDALLRLAGTLLEGAVLTAGKGQRFHDRITTRTAGFPLSNDAARRLEHGIDL